LVQVNKLLANNQDHALLLAPLANIMEAVKASCVQGMRMLTHPKATINDMKNGINLIIKFNGVIQDSCVKIEEVMHGVQTEYNTIEQG